jgi:predicted TIM-barrel fold metal-dependent hydrolase
MVVDTETHIFYYARSAIANPGVSRAAHYRWHEHDADLLVAEMDAAGVDKTFLISYDAEDTRWSAQHHGFDLEDFAGGRNYTLHGYRRHLDRFYWFNTLKDATQRPLPYLVDRDIADGATGFKLFPAYVQADLRADAWQQVFAHIQDRGSRLLISFETLDPPRSFSLPEYIAQLRVALEAAPRLPVALLHAGCADPLGEHAGLILDLCRDFPRVYLSLAMPGAIWDDGWEYPFRNLLLRVQRLKETVGSSRLMWATDWPWFGDRFLYPQGIDCFRLHAPFFDDEELARFLGGTAEEFVSLEGRA